MPLSRGTLNILLGWENPKDIKTKCFLDLRIFVWRLQEEASETSPASLLAIRLALLGNYFLVNESLTPQNIAIG